MHKQKQYIFKLISICFSFILYYFLRYKRFKKRIIQHPSKSDFIVIIINTIDNSGGAAKIATSIFKHLNKKNNASSMFVEKKYLLENNIFQINQTVSKKQDMLFLAQKHLQWQDFFHLSSFNIPKFQKCKEADLIHLHNLHSWNGFFSPFSLPEFCSSKPVVWTLHDMHAVTGHCAHSFECEKWKTGCGNCPHLDIYPKLTKDTTSFIWKTKKQIYQKCDMHIVVPSKWLQNIVSKSILKHLPCSVIYNGIDSSIYKKYDKEYVRQLFDIPKSKYVVLFSAELGINNPFKGGLYIKKLIDLYSKNQEILFINIGGGATLEKEKNIWNIPYIQDESEMAKWYSVADVYVYPSLADNCPLVILEAMSCGLPIVTFNTGGIPELVLHNKTGYVANYKDFDDLCYGFELFFNNIEIRKSMAEKSFERVHKYFTKELMNKQYLDLYKRLI